MNAYFSRHVDSFKEHETCLLRKREKELLRKKESEQT